MILLDANVLLYAYNADAPEHRRARAWLERVLVEQDRVAIPWITIWAFLRISTNSRLFSRPLTASEAFGYARAWLEHPKVAVVQPGTRHFEILQRLVTEGHAAGALLTDAALAALALEHGMPLASTDRDFARFATLKWLNPLDAVK